MKGVFLVALLVWLHLPGFGQKSVIADCGKQLRLRADTTGYRKYTGVIKVQADTVFFGNNQLKIAVAEPVLKKIFLKGLLYPEIISQILDGTKNMPYQLPAYGIHIAISDLTMEAATDDNPYSRIFSFLYWRDGWANPAVYVFELRNDSVIAGDTASFIENAHLTYIEFCTLQL